MSLLKNKAGNLEVTVLVSWYLLGWQEQEKASEKNGLCQKWGEDTLALFCT